VGPSVQTADLLNGIVATGRTTVSAEVLTATSSSNASGGMLGGLGVGRMAVWAMGVVALGNFVWL